MTALLGTKSEVAVGSNATSITIPKPSGTVEGDLLIAFISKDDSDDIVHDGSWTVEQTLNNGGAYRAACHWKIAGASEDPDYTWTSDNENWAGVLYRVTGFDSASPINASDSQTSASNAPISPSITTNVDDCLIIAWFGADDDDDPYSLDGALSEKWNFASGSSTASCGTAGGSTTQASQGLIGPYTHSQNAAEQWVGMTIAIAPSSGAITLVVQDATHSHSAETPALVQHHVLIANEAAHAQAAEVASLTQVHNLVVQETAHAHIAEQATLLQASALAVDDATHSQSAESPALTQVHVLAADESSHSQSADAPPLLQVHNIIVADAAHSLSSDNATLGTGTTLVVQDSTHAHNAMGGAFDPGFDPGFDKELALTQVHNLVVQDISHAHTAEAPTLIQHHTLVVQDSAHGHTSEAPTLLPNYVLDVNSASHIHAADNVALSVAGILVVQGAVHSHSAEQVQLDDGTTTTQADVDFRCEVSSSALATYTIVISDSAAAVYAVTVRSLVGVEYSVEITDRPAPESGVEVRDFAPTKYTVEITEK